MTADEANAEYDKLDTDDSRYAPPLNERCKHCRWFLPAIILNHLVSEFESHGGECRRFPKQVSSFTWIDEREWCGEFRKRQP